MPSGAIDRPAAMAGRVKKIGPDLADGGADRMARAGDVADFAPFLG